MILIYCRRWHFCQMLLYFFVVVIQLSLSYLTGLFKLLIYPNNFACLYKPHILPWVIEAVVVWVFQLFKLYSRPPLRRQPHLFDFSEFCISSGGLICTLLEIISTEIIKNSYSLTIDSSKTNIDETSIPRLGQNADWVLDVQISSWIGNTMKRLK